MRDSLLPEVEPQAVRQQTFSQQHPDSLQRLLVSSAPTPFSSGSQEFSIHSYGLWPSLHANISARFVTSQYSDISPSQGTYLAMGVKRSRQWFESDDATMAGDKVDQCPEKRARWLSDGAAPYPGLDRSLEDCDIHMSHWMYSKDEDDDWDKDVDSEYPYD
eukprot:gnl/MRDRNA2_/MRDRNA2_58460_c1_seq1.p1 gnl/MRDRNA2_/MRDRNA2_58460_c1~~gnl/MRDRNA2_/MRDRNA2_58460_c1_seq1.p1  ORF type:complete len:161 (+),score=27.50 gnl/MRDRNA2_/MRDRNA2_58460_c1_seq1:91-573(+)